MDKSFMERSWDNLSPEVVATILKPKVLSMFHFNKQFHWKTYQKANAWVAQKIRQFQTGSSSLPKKWRPVAGPKRGKKKWEGRGRRSSTGRL